MFWPLDLEISSHLRAKTEAHKIRKSKLETKRCGAPQKIHNLGKLLKDVVPPWASEDPDLRARKREGHPWAATEWRMKTTVVGSEDSVMSTCFHAESNGKIQDLKGPITSSGNQGQEWGIKSEHSGHKGYVNPHEATGSTLSVLVSIKEGKPEVVLQFLLQERKKNAYCSKEDSIF